MMSAILRQVLTAALTLWAILTIAYLCVYMLPGDPARIILGPQASSESVASFRREAGLDLPLTQQYSRFILRTFRLDLGYSFALRQPVNELLYIRGIVSLRLMGAAALLVVLIGLVLPLFLKALSNDGALSACAQIAQLAAFIPSYVLATLTLLIAAGWLGWAPVFFDQGSVRSWLLVALVLSAYPIALVLRVFIQRLDAELQAPYSRRARALGFSRAHILWCEALPNAFPAALAVLTNSIAFFATGAFFVEIVFGLPGLGRLAQEALRQKDIAVLLGVCLSFSTFVLLLSFALNLAQASLLPRSVASHAR